MRARFGFLLALGAVLAVALAAGCGGSAAAPSAQEQQKSVPADAVAVVGGTAVLKADFDQFFAQAQNAYKQQQRDFPKAGTAEYEQLKNEAVDKLILRVEFANEAKTLGITVTDDDVTKRLDELKAEFFQGEDGKVDETKYQEELKKQGLTEEDVRANLEAQVLNEAIFAEVTKGVTVADDEIRKYYDENTDRFTTSESREVAHILVETKAEADKLYQQLQDGADFAELAKKNSKDPGSAADGGKLTDEKGSFVPEFEEVAFALETGEIGKPVKSQFGWHIIKALADTKPEAVTPFDQATESIKSQLLQEQQAAAMTDWVAATRAKYAAQVAYAVGFAPPKQPATGTGTGTGTTSTAP